MFNSKTSLLTAHICLFVFIHVCNMMHYDLLLVKLMPRFEISKAKLELGQGHWIRDKASGRKDTGECLRRREKE